MKYGDNDYKYIVHAVLRSEYLDGYPGKTMSGIAHRAISSLTMRTKVLSLIKYDDNNENNYRMLYG